MDGVYRELDKVKTEMEELKEECRTKTELSESLRKAHGEQLIKFKEARLQIEKLGHELNANLAEISELVQLSENLKSCLHEKESLLKHLRFADEKLRVDFSKRIQESEEENRRLTLSLDEVTLRNQNLELKISSYKEETEGLKKLLSDRTKKSLEDEKKMQETEKVLQQRDDVIFTLEEENRNLADQLKWKSEKFTFLEEAHEKIQTQFESSKVEWKLEKSTMLEEMLKLQENFDSQTRVKERLETQLKICNQMLAHEESKRKVLEAEVAEFNSKFENVFTECQEAKSRMEKLTLARDEEIGEVRNLLRTKERVCSEMEYKIAQLEVENKEVKGSLKEFQVAEIEKAKVNSSSKKMQSKMKELEKLHAKCSMNLKEKETGWCDQMEKMREEMKDKTKQTQDLQVELENFQFLLDVQDEEIFVVMMVLHSVFSSALEEADSKLAKNIIELNQVKLELNKWKAMAEDLKLGFEENWKACKEEEKARTLKQQILSLESVIAAKTETMLAIMQEQEDLRSENAYLKEELSKKELLLGNIELLKHDSANASMGLIKRQIEIDVLIEVFKDAENLKRFTIEEKNAAILRLEVEADALFQKLKIQEASLVSSIKRGEQIEALLLANKMETEKLRDRFEKEQSHKEALLGDNMTLSSYNEDLLIQIQRIYEEMDGHLCKDLELTGTLGKMLMKPEEEKGPELDSTGGDDHVGSTVSVYGKFCPSKKGVAENIHNRLPLMELNC